MKSTTLKIAASVLFGGSALVGGGVVITDQSIDPYTDTGTTLQIAKPSTVDSAGEITEVADKTTPRIELSKWSGQATLGITYQGMASTTAGSRPFMSKNVEWTDGVQTMQETPLDASTTMEDGGMEINIILASEPSSNVFPFKIDGTNDMDFFYQAPLWQDAGLKAPTADCTDTDCTTSDGTSHRDPNVVGSYAVYSKDKKDHIEGQVNHATGKLFHIFRPTVTDAKGNTTLADLAYADGVLNVTVPQSFLDSAVYPVKVDPTFGYTTMGASSENTEDFMKGNKYVISGGGNLTLLTRAEKIDSSNGHHEWLAVYDNSSPANLVAYSVDSTTLYGDSVIVWRSFPLNGSSQTSLQDNTTYRLVSDQGGTTPAIAYDTGLAVTYKASSASTYPPTTSQTFSDTGYGANRTFSIYATYATTVRTVDTSAFTYCRTLTSNNDGYTDGIATTTTGLFPLIATTTLSTLAATSSSGHVSSLNSGDNSAGQTPLDVVFVDESSCSFSKGATAIPHFFEKYASTTGAFTVHLGTSNVSSTTAKKLAMYYGVSTTTNLNSPGQVYATTSPLVPGGIWTLGLPGQGTTTIPEFLDSTYNGNHASSGNLATMPASGITTGYIDGALLFNGSTNALEVPDSSTIKPTAQMTISAWVKFAGTGSFPMIVCKNVNTNFQLYFEGNSTLTSGWGLDINDTDVEGAVNAKVTTSWYHVVGTYDGANMKVYQNGVIDGTAAKSGAINTSVGNLIIGAYNTTADPGGDYWNGNIDDVRLYATALTSSDVRTLYNNESNSAVFWTFGAEQTQGAATAVTSSSKILQTLGKVIQTLGNILQP